MLLRVPIRTPLSRRALPSSAFVAVLAIVTLTLGAGPVRAQMTGDTNCDSRLDAADVRDLMPVVFGDSASSCFAGEVNDDSSITAADVIAAIATASRPTPMGAQISYVGVVGSNGTAIGALGNIGDTPVFFRTSGSGFRIVVEGLAGINRVAAGKDTFDYDPSNPNRRPDLQIGCTQALGDGSSAVCDSGVPAIPAPHFNGRQRTADALNDLSCIFDVISSSRFACTIDRFQNANFIATSSEVQFCLQVTQRVEFPAGDTLCTVQIRDEGGTLGPAKEFIIRVSSGPVPATFTATAVATSTPTATLRPSNTPSRTATRTGTIGPSPTSGIATPTFARTSPTTPGVPSATPTISATRTVTRTPTRSHSPSLTPTRTISASPTASRSATRTATPSSPQGPVVTFFGLARADEALIQPSGVTEQGVPIYARPFGNGFRIVVEGAPGPSFEDPGLSSYSFGAAAFADLQIQSTRALGNGSASVCDRDGTNAGGVPGINPPAFQPTSMILDATNDFSCRFVDGGGAFRGRTNTTDSCVQNPPDSGVFLFVDPRTRVQYCALVDSPIRFPAGETVLTVRLRDVLGNVGVQRQIVVRIDE